MIVKGFFWLPPWTDMFLLHVCLFIVSDWGEQSQFKPTTGSSITLCQACQLVHRNPQSDFDSGIVLLMHACFTHPRGWRRFVVYEQTLLWHTGLFCVIQLEKDTMMKHSGGMLMSAEQDSSKDPWRIMQFGWTYKGLGCMRINNNLYVVVFLLIDGSQAGMTNLDPHTCTPTNNSSPCSTTHNINPSPVPLFLLHTITSLICTINIPF